MPAAQKQPQDEGSIVEAWRLEQLEAAGYPTAAAQKIAADPHIDLHRAVEMLEQGCDPLTAIDILI